MLISLGAYYGAAAWTLADLFAQGQGGLVYLTSAENLYTETAGTTNVSPGGGDLVASVDDMYGPVAYRGTQATAAKRPLHPADKNMLSFDGQDDAIDTGTNGVGSTKLLCKPSEQFFLAIAMKTSGTSGVIVARGGSAYSIRPLQIYMSPNASETPAIRIMGSAVNATGWGLNDGLLHVIWLNWDGLNLRGGHDNVVDVPLSVGSRDDEELDQTITIGARTDGGTSYFFTGQIGSLVIRDQAASQEEIANTVSFLRDFHS